MKKIFYSIVAVAALFTVASCSQDRLEIPQKGVTPYESFYQTDEDAQSALNAAYAALAENICSCGDAHVVVPYYAIFNLCGDDMIAAGAYYGDNDYLPSMNEFRYDNQIRPIIFGYDVFYLTIYKCNLVIDNFKDGTSAIQKRCVAEARTLRAWLHMCVAILWGCPPLVDHVLTGDAKPYNCDLDPDRPMSHEDLLAWCGDECMAAAPDLEERKSPLDKNGAVKITQGFAYGVAGRSYLFAGSQYYDKSKAALKKVIDSGKYELVPGERMNEIFHVAGDGNEEKVFECNVVCDPSISSFTMYFRSKWQHTQMFCWKTPRFTKMPTCCGIEGWGMCAPSESFTKALIENDGIDSWRRKMSIINIEEVCDKYEAEGISDVVGIYGNHEWLMFKYICTPEDMYQKTSDANFVLMRYAEILLMYAEVCALTNDNDGLKYLNMIQERAGSKHISSSLTLQEVKNEKLFELWLEGHRWPDMCRYQEFDGVMNAGKNIPTLYDAKYTGKDSPTRFYVEHTNPNPNSTGFQRGKHELLPYPDYEILVNPNMKQNPGW